RRTHDSAYLTGKAEGDTIGGVVECVIKGCPAGLGDPVFGKLHAMLGAAMLGINAAKGFDYGMGFDGVGLRGSEAMDPFEVDPATGRVSFAANHSGGIQGGISNGADIYFRVAFKPVATLLREVATINDSGESVTLRARGRHDPCVVSRAVPIVEAMAALTILDAMLGARCARR
ncbi:MAG: chorismate synthase, partial [Paramuribaculum sp.]|nr:chorismate synthase [Paramuribaculum sp.]